MILNTNSQKLSERQTKILGNGANNSVLTVKMESDWLVSNRPWHVHELGCSEVGCKLPKIN